ncbi:type II toxin-antitoxin system VapC family toxin [Sagittula stellata]|uniref:PilT protein-like n=1 Tax=Sagittula stellata (strain ATCC 700073 / DSM 11524 / E-37) TaxID=388399 RepID=A3KAQ2_SAGS3|nr:type II toxin-antitoxin system VapC family toxin [Sagittula stellata]EBA05758.1 PilT protein-like [Sagittula stellata E-37]
MSALLLDTNAFAMILTDDPRLTDTARDAILGATRVALSVISLYEIGQKVRLGKWPEMDAFASDLAVQAQNDGIDLLPLSPAAALQAALLDWEHRDPFDRMIACVARAEGLDLVSSDTAFDALTLSRIW